MFELPEDSFFDLVLPLKGASIGRGEAMEIAVKSAYQGLGWTDSNPLVGTVIVDEEHKFLGAGCHRKFGGHHAEVEAIENVEASGVSVEGKTIYVTLEPCAHVGKTPSCAELLVKKKVAKVIYAARDPFEKVNGKGIEKLRQAGIEVEHFRGGEFAPANKLIEVFSHNVRTNRPFVALKIAMSLNGVTGFRGDKRVFITGKRARDYGHFLRQKYDAILVGAETVVCDNPKLDVRNTRIKRPRNPWRVVLDPTARAMASGTHLLSEPNKLLWVVSNKADVDAPYVVRPPTAEISLDWLLSQLWDRGVRSLLVEGGVNTQNYFLEKELVDQLHLFYAPKLMENNRDALRVSINSDGWQFRRRIQLENDWMLELMKET